MDWAHFGVASAGLAVIAACSTFESEAPSTAANDGGADAADAVADASADASVDASNDVVADAGCTGAWVCDDFEGDAAPPWPQPYWQISSVGLPDGGKLAVVPSPMGGGHALSARLVEQSGSEQGLSLGRPYSGPPATGIDCSLRVWIQERGGDDASFLGIEATTTTGQHYDATYRFSGSTGAFGLETLDTDARTFGAPDLTGGQWNTFTLSIRPGETFTMNVNGAPASAPNPHAAELTGNVVALDLHLGVYRNAGEPGNWHFYVDDVRCDVTN